MNEVVLRVTDLEKHFVVHAREAEIVAVDGLSFEARAGSTTALVGPSGAGKSTVLKCIHRTYRPTAGSIELLSAEGTVDLTQCDDRAAAIARERHIGFVTQFLHCLPRRSALDVVARPLVLDGIASEAARTRAAGLLRELGIPERLWNLPPATFSGGEQQRVNIARGFARGMRLLLLDEPTASLDPATADRVLGLITRARDAGSAIILIMHQHELLARVADHRVEVRAPATAEA